MACLSGGQQKGWNNHIPSYFSVFVSVSVLFFQSDMGVGSEIKIISAQTLLQVNIGNASTATLGILLRDGIVFQAFSCWSDLLLVFCKVADAEFTHNSTKNNECGYCYVPHFETNPHHPNIFVFVSGTHTVPDVVQTFVLLQACGAPVMQVCQNCTHTSFFYLKKVL